MTDYGYIYGTFIKETPNRFLCTVLINNETVECYIPSSCRLSNFLTLEGQTVILIPNNNPKARTRFSVYAVKVGRQFILLNLSKANLIIETELRTRRFAFLGQRKHVSTEKNIAGYKSDLFIEDTNTIIEVKSVLSFEKTAYFPTIYSERGVKQLFKLSSLLDQGYRICYIFVSLNPYVKTIMLNDTIVEYTNSFRECISKGMKCYGFTIKLQNAVPLLCSQIPTQIE